MNPDDTRYLSFHLAFTLLYRISYCIFSIFPALDLKPAITFTLKPKTLVFMDMFKHQDVI